MFTLYLIFTALMFAGLWRWFGRDESTVTWYERKRRADR